MNDLGWWCKLARCMRVKDRAGQKLCVDESRNLETIGARMWKKKSTTIELHRVNQVRLEGKSLNEHGGE